MCTSHLGLGWVKIETFEGIYQTLAKHVPYHRIFCGDFNSPQRELVTGQIITWGQKINKNGSYYIPKGLERWYMGERSVLEGLKQNDLIDTIRLLNGYEKTDFSFVLNRKDIKVCRRFDHCFASSTLYPVKAIYVHQLREEKLSDHSGLLVFFEPKIMRYRINEYVILNCRNFN